MAERQACHVLSCLCAILGRHEFYVAPGSHQMPFCGAAQEVDTSVPPSSEKRSSKPPKVGFRTIFPASRHSPWAKCGDWSRKVAGACEKICEMCSRSEAEFIFISTRLSHWERTLAWILLGRWVATSRYKPNLRPSPAILIAWLVA